MSGYLRPGSQLIPKVLDGGGGRDSVQAGLPHQALHGAGFVRVIVLLVCNFQVMLGMKLT